MPCNTKGRIHSIETFGTVDGPGIRFVVFTQGCPMRCLYCHNPDTWDKNAGTEMMPDEILSLYLKNKAFYRNGGLTVSGGEPLLQKDFLEDLFFLAKQHGIHTALDTSGILFQKDNKHVYDTLLNRTDLILLDIKHINDMAHQKLCGFSNESVLAFAKYLSDIKKDVWIRHVVVPGLTDNPSDLFALGQFVGTLKNVCALDVLPYHTMGAEKYKKIGICYPLEGIPALTADACQQAKKEIIRGIHAAHNSNSK